MFIVKNVWHFYTYVSRIYGSEKRHRNGRTYGRTMYKEQYMPPAAGDIIYTTHSDSVN